MLQLSSSVEAGEAGSSWNKRHRVLRTRFRSSSREIILNNLRQQGATHLRLKWLAHHFSSFYYRSIQFRHIMQNIREKAMLCWSHKCIKTCLSLQLRWRFGKAKTKESLGGCKTFGVGTLTNKHWKGASVSIILFSCFHFLVPWMTSGRKEINESSLGEAILYWYKYIHLLRKGRFSLLQDQQDDRYENWKVSEWDGETLKLPLTSCTSPMK